MSVLLYAASILRDYGLGKKDPFAKHDDWEGDMGAGPKFDPRAESKPIKENAIANVACLRGVDVAFPRMLTVVCESESEVAPRPSVTRWRAAAACQHYIACKSKARFMFLPTIPTPPFNDCMREFHIVRNRESERGPCPIAFAFYQACSTQGVHPSENLKQKT